MSNIDYIGNELELFKHAHNWKAYYKSAIDPFIKGDVCEVGAGLGGTTTALINEKSTSWTAVEPDADLSSMISNELNGNSYAGKVKVIHGILDDIEGHIKFDTILYIDVIEHIEHDDAEFAKASSRLKPGGHLIILVPAFNFLYNSFDKSIGHFRRYDKPMLKALEKGKRLERKKLSYFDSMGFFASTVNKLFLNKSTPSEGNIKLWDGVLVPFSKVFDPIIFRAFGKSLIGVWQKPTN